MQVVTNSSPLCYLMLIDQIHLLPLMFKQILVPEAVVRELCDGGAPNIVREWIARPPRWLRVQKPAGESGPQMERLHAGEREVILLAREIEADLVVMDEKAARRLAREQGLNVTGLIGILDEVATRGLVDLLTAVEHLRQTNFRASPHLLKMLLDRHYFH